MKQIEIVVAPDGTSRVETKGFAGSSCQQVSRLLEQALGQKKSEQLTPDFYRTDVSQQQQARQQQ